LPFLNIYYQTKNAKKASMAVNAVSSADCEASELREQFSIADSKSGSEEVFRSVLKVIDKRFNRAKILVLDGQPRLVVDIGLSETMPINLVGQGFSRTVQILSQLYSEKVQVCLIDEIEVGLHYTALTALWKGIAAISERLGVQLFITTHSRDAILAAHDTLHCDDPEDRHDFGIIQLMRHPDGIIGQVLDESEVAGAIRNDIDVR
jgi:AAA15 family ATPase/GTPase